VREPKKINGGGVNFLSQDNLHYEDLNRKTANVTTNKGGGILLELGSDHWFEPGFWASAHRAAVSGIDSDCISAHVPANPCPAAVASPLANWALF
jgi:hypothetical protein